jgi:hypothetical protein
MTTTAPTSTIADEPSVRFLILDILRGIMRSHGTFHLGVRPGKRTVTENIVRDMKQYFIIKTPKEIQNSLDNTEVAQLEREYQAI